MGYNTLVSNTWAPDVRVLDNFHPQEHCAAVGKSELNAKQQSKS
jgi:hypothetical protein